MGSLALWLNVSSMNQEPVVSGLNTFFKDKCDFHAYRYDESKEAQFHYDGEVDHNILRKVRELKPDIILYSGPAGGNCKPKTETLQILREHARTIGYFLDGGCPEWHPLLEEYKSKNVFDVMANTDGNPNWPKRAQDVTVWQTMCPTFYKETPKKDIRFGFAGGAGSKHRQDAIRELRQKCGLNVAERSENWGSYQKHFADFMLRCKATVNFPETGSGKTYHLKNRIIEAGFANVCVFEKKNPITKTYFNPQGDYIEYETIPELIDIVNNISDSEMALKANNLSLKCREFYTPERAWEQVFSKLL